MGMNAVPPGNPSPVAIGLETGTIAVIASLVFLLSYLQIVHAADERLPVGRLLVALALPLTFVFVTVIVDKALVVL